MKDSHRNLVALLVLAGTAYVFYRMFGGVVVALLALVLAIVYALSRVFAGHPKRTLSNWSGDGVCEDLEPGDAGVLIYALPGAICAATLLWLETKERLRVTSEIPLTLEWIGPPPYTPLEEAVYGATGEDDWAEVLQVLYRRTNDLMATFSAPATARHYREFVDSLWEDDLEKHVEEPGLEVWMVLRDAGRDWDRLGDDEASRRVKRAVRISGRLETTCFSDDFLAKTWKDGAEGFFRYRDDQAPEFERQKDGANRVCRQSAALDHGIDAGVRRCG
ncbi:MAG: hypothetical protein ABFS86_16350 [Planctomycetota bacterium]